jgi:hypothetical protein
MGERRDAYEATGYAGRRLKALKIGSRAWTPSDLPGTSMTRRPIPDDVADAFGEALVSCHPGQRLALLRHASIGRAARRTRSGRTQPDASAMWQAMLVLTRGRLPHQTHAAV